MSDKLLSDISPVATEELIFPKVSMRYDSRTEQIIIRYFDADIGNEIEVAVDDDKTDVFWDMVGGKDISKLIGG